MPRIDNEIAITSISFYFLKRQIHTTIIASAYNPNFIHSNRIEQIMVGKHAQMLCDYIDIVHIALKAVSQPP
ncbi:hypothetical protein AO286_10940 [Pseudomonas syringae]|uniref:Uncharacterized protein n=1 Tax=Pseudomonas syringae group genomosp. 3 TaxID=251701 RepID=A0ABD6VCP6_9PSED|nr:hypothetical protein AO286_10940 [Pseudomonas syringae]POD69867.1 hypothetical protein BKM07_10990 [Pseudomonas syringae group genomosp. 3]